MPWTGLRWVQHEQARGHMHAALGRHVHVMRLRLLGSVSEEQQRGFHWHPNGIRQLTVPEGPFEKRQKRIHPLDHPGGTPIKAFCLRIVLFSF